GLEAAHKEEVEVECGCGLVEGGGSWGGDGKRQMGVRPGRKKRKEKEKREKGRKVEGKKK
uniref:Uncharacterized protein n=1 Tax=Oryza brachyantha TaxID=4533 RepID=J3MDY0_ORYBR